MTTSSGSKPKRNRKARSPELSSGKNIPSAAIEEATAIAADYRLTLDELSADEYAGSCIEVPTVIGYGATIDECVADTRKSLIATLAQIIADGGVVPAAAREGKRDQQVNVRFTVQERQALEAAARSAGFRSVADLIRNVALAQV